MTLCNGEMRFCRFTNFFLMVYLSYSNSYDMNCFSFLSSNKESRTFVRLSLLCRGRYRP